VKRRRSIISDLVNFLLPPFSPHRRQLTSAHECYFMETKQRLLLGRVNSRHIDVLVLIIGVSPEHRVRHVRAADAFSRGLFCEYLRPPANFRPIYEKNSGVTLDLTQIRKVNFVRRGHRSQVGMN
jgi:hypothetical protein